MTRARLRRRMPEAKYHAHPALSSTGARRLLESPAHFDWWRSHPEAPKQEFDLGSAIHSKVLGTGYAIDVLDFKDYRTNAAKEAAAASRAKGRVPVLRHVYDAVDPIAENVLAHPGARPFLEHEGDAEVSAFNADPATGVEVRARFDYLLRQPKKLPPVAVDLKSTGTSASPSAFARSSARFGYDVQQGHYEFVHDTDSTDLRMVFIVAEVEPPYLVGVYVLDREFIEIGRKKAAIARQRFAECTATGVWPGYSPHVVALHPPVFHVNEFMEMTADV